jgi:hypothetical protein
MIQSLQAQGFAKNAPAQYPGHAASQALVQRALSLPDQYKLGLMTSPGTQAILDRVFGGGTGATGGGTTTADGAAGAGGPVAGARGPGSATRSEAEGGPPAAGSPGAAVAQQVHDFWIKQGYSEPVVAGIMAGGPGSESDFTPTVFGDKGTSYGLYQHHGERLANMQKYFGLSGSQMPSADQQNQYAAWEISPAGPLAKVGEQLKTAKTAEEAATIWTRDFGVPGDKTEIGRRARGAGRYLGLYGAPGSATAAATPPGVQMGGDAPPPPGGAPGAYPATGGGMGAAVAGTAPNVQANTGGPQQTVAPPPVIRAQPIPAGRFASPVAGDVGAMQSGMQLAQTETPSRFAQPTLAAGTAAGPVPAPSVEPPPQPGWGSAVGTYGGPPNTLMPPPVVAQSVAPAPVPQQPPPPAATAPVATGVNSPQFQLAQQKLRQAAAIAAMPGYQYNPQLQAAAAYLKEQAAALAQADSVVTDPRTGIQTHTLTGKQDDPAKPLADYRETSPGSGIWVGGPGTEPRFQPPGRLVVTPGGDVYQTTSGGPVLLKHSDPAAVAALEAAKTSGAAAGAATGKLTAALADQGRTSAQAIGNIDYGISQLDKAKAGGITTGYFAPWLGTVSAIAKSLGIPPETIGVDPAAVGNIQTAQKTLAVVSGAILQQVLGSDSQITDAKLQHFIHAQPGIETDPDAVSRVLNWARSQFVYEREMAAQGMKDASDTGLLPTNWQAKYFRDHGFAPIYNPGTGEMQQPDGGAPSREPPATVKTAPVNPSARTAGTTYQTPKGPMKWTGTGWLSAQ